MHSHFFNQLAGMSDPTNKAVVMAILRGTAPFGYFIRNKRHWFNGAYRRLDPDSCFDVRWNESAEVYNAYLTAATVRKHNVQTAFLVELCQAAGVSVEEVSEQLDRDRAQQRGCCIVS
jgi:hypothetical protein